MNQTDLATAWRPSPDWSEIRLRAEVLRQTRAFFQEHDFLEVETPLLSTDTVVDAEIEPISLSCGIEGKKFFLQTSPELCMKRLLAAGGEALFQITRAFRDEECGPLHNPEFTILEWYRLGDSMQKGMDFLSDLFQSLMNTDRAIRCRYRDAFLKFTGLDPFTCEAAQFAQVATANGLAAPAQLGDDIDDWLDFLLIEMVMPHLGLEAPVILYDYPASQAALANVRAEAIPVAERFELFYQGIELANGYHELCDPHELARRTAQANAKRTQQGRRPLPDGGKLHAAMKAGLPPCTGVALGVDRLVMLAAKKKQLDEVIAFTIDRA
ncbi:MAG: EF-P lysine aminoacylase GenX [Planctomycetaceae bacterium]|nr:EF-P lysine aminoacylase GenX [Planctomycetaceae bacterium]|tara:strand:- start:289 stop:1263 length:975 start_codon:yes stop_codon:yes gene_type:complete